MARKQHKYHYIYKTKCSITGRYYIGMHSTSNLEDGYLGSGRRLWLSINKHGKENHTKEILEFLENRQALKNREHQLVNDDALKDPMCMNLAVGGEGGFISKEGYKKGAKKRNDIIWSNSDFIERKKKKMGDTAKRLHKDGILKHVDWTGRSHREETKNKIGSANAKYQAGSGNSMYNTCWIYKDNISKSIKKNELVNFLALGWKPGRKIKK